MLRVYHGNDMEVLRALALRRLAADPPPPLVAERVVIPNVGMAKWFRHGMAEHCGIAAQLSCESPGRFLDALAASVLGPAEEAAAGAWAKEQLGLRIMGLLPQLLHQAGFEPLAQYLADTRDPRRLLALAQQLGSLFDQYLLYRPHWMLAWEQGRAAPGEPERRAPWQPLLWRAVCAAITREHPGANHGAARSQRLLEALGGPRELPALPARVTGFALGALPPALLAILDALGERSDVCLYHFNPCREYWGEVVDERTLARLQLRGRAQHAERGNALLASWGRLGREQLGLLLEHTGAELIECFRDPVAPQLLGRVQADILDLVEGGAPSAPLVGDCSMVFAETHSRLREIEALHDALLEMFERLPGLRPREIVVMAPEIADYAVHIEAVFGAPGAGAGRIPFTIADRAEVASGALARGFLHLLSLPESRFAASEVFGLLAVPALTARAGLDAAAVEGLRALVAEAGVRWGYDATASAGSGPGIARNTWRFGLERLLLGLALEEDTLFQGIAPLGGEGVAGAEALGLLADFVDRLAGWARRLVAPRAPAAWKGELEELIEAFFARDGAWRGELALLREALAAQFDALGAAGCNAPLPREVLQDLLDRRLREPDGAHAFLRGAVSFCQLTPLRSIPFRVVCLLGMNADSFPRNRQRAGFDLMAEPRLPGDPSRRDDDRYLFLESLLAARECLYISRVARDEQSDATREPAVPVTELCDYLDAHWGEGTAEQLTRRHRLKPFHEDYYRGGGALFSYRHEWLAAVRGGDARAAAFCATPLPPRPSEPPGLRALVAFFRNPCQAFLEQRFAVRLEELDAAYAMDEPFTLEALEAYGVRQALVEGALAGRPAEPRLLAAGGLPHGAAGRELLADEAAAVQGLLQRLGAWRELPPQTVELELQVGTSMLRGALTGVRGGALREFSVSGEATAPALLAFWIRHLAACAGGVAQQPSELLDLDDTWRLPVLPHELAARRLQELLQLREEGLRAPLPLFPRAALAWARKLHAGKDEETADAAAQNAFTGGPWSRGDLADPHVARIYPDAEAALGEQFRQLAGRVCAPLVEALAEGGS